MLKSLEEIREKRGNFRLLLRGNIKITLVDLNKGKAGIAAILLGPPLGGLIFFVSAY